MSLNKEYRVRGYGNINPTTIKVMRDFNPRFEFDDDAQKELKDSILVNGVEKPLTVKEEADGSFSLVDGERRLRAILELIAEGHPIQSVTAKIEPANTPVDSLLLKSFVSNDGVKLSQIEEARMVDRFSTVYSWTVEAIAKKTGKSVAVISHRLNLWKSTPENVKQAIAEGIVSTAEALKMTKEAAGSPEKTQIALIKKQEKEEKQKQFQKRASEFFQRVHEVLPPEFMKEFEDILFELDKKYNK